MNKLTLLLLTLQLTVVGLSWLPVMRLGGTVIEVSNLGALMLIAALPLVALPHLRFPLIFGLLYACFLGLFIAFGLHGGEGANRLIMTIVATTAALTIANLPGLSQRTLVRAILIAYPVFWFFFWLSARIAGEDLLGAAFDYLTTLNRRVFVYQVLRPTFNAFAGANDIAYVASTINGLAGTFFLFFLLGLACWRTGPGAKIVCLSAFVTLFVLFSTTSVLSAAYVLILWSIVWVKASPTKIGPLLGIGFAIVLLFALSGDLTEYVAFNILSDQNSRGARLAQYAASIDLINNGLLFGNGYVTIDRHNIHNFPLFAMVSGGIVTGALAFMVYGIVGWTTMTSGLRYIRFGLWQDLAISGLMFFFLIRLTAAGGGGLPAGPGAVALGLAMLISAQRRAQHGTRSLPRNRPSHPAGSAPAQGHAVPAAPQR